MATQPISSIHTVTPENSDRGGFFSRILRSLAAARQRKVQRDLAEILARRGGVMAGNKVGQASLPRATPFHILPALNAR